MKAIYFLVVLCLGIAALAQVATADSKTAVVVVDVQADFTTAHKGSLAVAGTDEAFLKNVVKATQDLKAAGLSIYATQDWHPAQHISFAANNKGSKPFELVTLKDGRKQVMWPAHCVQKTDGAKLLLDTSMFKQVVQKGMDVKYDSYSGFRDDGGADTVMDKTLKADGIKTVVVYGIATDYCVKATAMDALAAGYKVVVVQDLCRGVAPETSKTAWAEMEKAGITLWPSLDVKKVKEL
jgi:nicotinamidase/pyrazinamidase